MADKQAIIEILGKLGWAYDAGQIDYWAEVFASDARFTITIAGMGQVGDYRSRETILKLARDAKASQSDQRRHVVTNTWFSDETATSATSVSFITLISTQNGSTKVLSAGVYTDKFVLNGGKWQIVHRDLHLDAPY